MTTRRGPRHLNELLAPGSSPLADLVHEASHRQSLDRALGEFLDQPLRDHVCVASVQDGMLVLAADTPVWGHRVRYLAPALLEHLRRHESGLHDVRIIVRPVRSEPTQPPRAPRPAVSRSAASVLEHVASDCNNSDLARVLRRLAARASTPDD